ncbi:unnamed protein product, partial [Allacma fusca]
FYMGFIYVDAQNSIKKFEEKKLTRTTTDKTCK